MTTRNGSVELVPKQRQATGGMPMQGKSKAPGNVGHGASGVEEACVALPPL